MWNLDRDPQASIDQESAMHSLKGYRLTADPRFKAESETDGTQEVRNRSASPPSRTAPPDRSTRDLPNDNLLYRMKLSLNCLSVHGRANETPLGP